MPTKGEFTSLFKKLVNTLLVLEFGYSGSPGRFGRFGEGAERAVERGELCEATPRVPALSAKEYLQDALPCILPLHFSFLRRGTPGSDATRSP